MIEEPFGSFTTREGCAYMFEEVCVVTDVGVRVAAAGIVTMYFMSTISRPKVVSEVQDRFCTCLGWHI